MAKRYLAAVLLGLPLAVTAADLAHIQRTGELEVCAKADALPYSSRAPADDGLPGFQIEIAERLAAALGVELKLSWVSLRWQASRTGCDAFIGVPDLGRGGEPGVIRLTEPYTAVSMVLVTPGAGPPLSSIDDLAGRTVAVASGTLPYYGLKQYGIGTVERFFDDRQILQTLLSGEADAAVVSDMGLGWFARQHPGFEYTVSATDFIDPRDRYNYAVALRKADQPTVARFNALLQGLREDGTLAAILHRYGIALRPPLAPGG